MMNNDDFNSWACDIANDYQQALQEMGPDDFKTWDEYSHERLEECNEAWEYVMSQPSTPPTKVVRESDDWDELPF